MTACRRSSSIVKCSVRLLADLNYQVTTPPQWSNGKVRAARYGVTWLTWLIIALLVATLAALTGIKPKESRPVAHTRLMGVARFVLVVAFLFVAAYIALRTRSGG